MAESRLWEHAVMAMVVCSFGMLLLCRSLNLHDQIPPAGVRYILTVICCVGIAALVAFALTRNNYITYDAKNSNSEDEMQHTDGPVSYRVYLEKISLFSATSSLVARYAKIISVYIFGSGCLFGQFLIIYGELQCLPFFKELHQSSMTIEKGSDNKYFGYLDSLSSVISSVAKILFYALTIPMLHFCAKIKGGNCSKVRYFLIPVIATNFSLWLYAFVNSGQFFNVFNYDYPQQVDKTAIRDACLNHSSLMEVYVRGSLTKIFYPVSMEFCIIAIGILYHVFFIKPLVLDPPKEDKLPSVALEKIAGICRDIRHRIQAVKMIEKPNPYETLDGNHHGEDSEVALLDPNHNNTYQRNNIQGSSSSLQEEMLIVELMAPKKPSLIKPSSLRMSLWLKLINFHTPFIALVYSLIENAMVIMFINHSSIYNQQTQNYNSCINSNNFDWDALKGDLYIDRYYLNVYIHIPLTLIRIFLSNVPALLVTVHCLLAVRHCTISRQPPSIFKTSLILGIIGSAMITIYEVCICSATLVPLKDCGDHYVPHDVAWVNVLTMAMDALYLPQYVLQTVLIYLIQHRITNPRNPMQACFQTNLSFLAMYNIMQWANLSFLEKNYFSEQYPTFGQYIVLLGIPTFIYFRFMSTMVILELKELVRADHASFTKWHLYLKLQLTRT